MLDVDAHQVPPGIAEGMVECLFILNALALSIGDHSVSIADKDKHSAVVDSVQRGHIGHRVRLHEEERELARVEAFLLGGSHGCIGTQGGCALESIHEVNVTEVDGFVEQVSSVVSFKNLLFFGEAMEIFEVLPSAELLHHDHLILPHLRCDLQQLVLLRLLGEVDDISPPLLVLLLEGLQELIE